MNKALIKDALTLTVITLIAGLLLGLVQMITKKPIEKQNEKTQMEAYAQVFKKADSFEKIDGVNPEKDSAAVLKKAGLSVHNTIDGIVKAVSGSDDLGYVVTVTNSEGYGGDITLTLGVTSEGEITGIAFTELNETPGLGMKAEQSEFRKQFRGIKADKIKYTKSGASKDDEIDALSGATITTNAVTNGVNAGLAYVNSLKGGK